MDIRRLKLKENAYQKVKVELGREREDSPTEEQIPVPPTDEISPPIKEPVDDDKPTNPIIDEDRNREKMIV